MLLSSKYALLILAALLLLAPRGGRAAEEVTSVAVDAAAPKRAASPDAPPEALASWVKWARLSEGQAVEAVAASPLTARAARYPGGVSLMVTNSGDTVSRLRAEVRLPRGLWRVEAVVAGEKTRSWRMESILKTKPEVAAKPVSLAAGETLFLRFTETVAAAQGAYRAAALTKEAAPTDFLRGRVGRALTPVGASLGTVAGLVAKGDRAGVAKKTHRALLAAAQAQAVWENGRGATLASRDAAFADLMTALSEISCAAYNLVPQQTEVIGVDGKRVVRITVTNAGTRTVPLVALGVQGAAEGEGHAAAGPEKTTVFGALAPGEKVAATFAPKATVTQGIVQFILGMGAAVVSAIPLP